MKYVNVGLIPGVVIFGLSRNPISEAGIMLLSEIILAVGLSETTHTILFIVAVFTIPILGSMAAINGIYSIFLFINFSLLQTNSSRLWMEKLRF